MTATSCGRRSAAERQEMIRRAIRNFTFFIAFIVGLVKTGG
jgi:hypothetical protein